MKKVFFFNAGGCNGCALECLACEDPRYNMERVGIRITDNESEADAAVIMGNINRKMRSKVRDKLKKFTGKKIALGTCAISGGIFKGTENINASADDIAHIDYYVPGCPPRPCSIIKTILDAYENKISK